jgi:ABC-type uncharacterized transport system permease subunit
MSVSPLLWTNLAAIGSTGGASTVPVAMLSTLWMTSAVAVVGYIVAWWSGSREGSGFMRWLVVAWLAHALALVIDVVGLGEGARFGFASALSATLWLVIAAHATERAASARRAAWRVLCVAGIVGVVLSVVFPGRLITVESPWAPLHWLLGLVASGLVGAAVVHAWLLDRSEHRLRAPRPAGAAVVAQAPALPLMTLERLTFRFVQAGFWMLTVALALGSVFALRSAAGWQWNHKTVFSLLAWSTLAALLAGRRVWGWRGRRATRWVYAGALFLFLAYVGSRFVFQVLLGRAA